MVAVEIAPSAAQAGVAVAERIARLVLAEPSAVIGVATGSSPEPVYAHLATLVERGLDVSGVTWFALDEYLGLPAGHPQSYRAVLERALIAPLRLNPATVHVPNGTAADPDRAAVEYEDAIQAAGGIDLQLLGIGGNGHIGFNEPGTPFDAPTRRATLTVATRADNARFFPRLASVPRECLTQGLATIRRARRIELIATGRAKAHAVSAALHGPVTPILPASMMQEHPDAHCTLDPEAARALPVTV